MTKYSSTKNPSRPNEYMKVRAFYDLGGESFIGNQKKRGLYLTFTLVERTRDETSTTESFSPMDDVNFTILIKELKRKSQKQMDKMVELFMAEEHHWFQEYKNYIDNNSHKINEMWEQLVKDMK